MQIKDSGMTGGDTSKEDDDGAEQNRNLRIM